MPPLTLPRKGLTKGPTTPPTRLWKVLHQAAPACDLAKHDRPPSPCVWSVQTLCIARDTPPITPREKKHGLQCGNQKHAMRCSSQNTRAKNSCCTVAATKR